MKKNFLQVLIILSFISSITYGQQFDYYEECDRIDEYIFAGDYKGGIDYLLQKIWDIEESERTPDSSYSFFILELGKMYYYTNELDKAEKEILKSIQLDKELLGDESASYISGLANLMELYREMGLFEKALEAGNQAHSIYNKIDIPDSLDYTYFCNNYGILCSSLGNLSTAEHFLNKSLALNNLLLDSNHHEKAPILNNLAVLHKKKGQYALAEKNYLRVLELDKLYYGNQHEILSTGYNNLGNLYSLMGNLSEGEKYFLMAKELHEKKGSHGLGYVHTLTNLSAIYIFRNEILKAKLTIRRCMNILDDMVSKNHDLYLTLYNRLSHIAMLQKDYQGVLDILSEPEYNMEQSNPDHLNLIWINYDRGLAYFGLQKYDSAEIKYKRALSIAEITYKKYHKDYIKILCSLAELKYKTNSGEEAEALYIESMELFRQNILRNFNFLSAIEKEKYLTVLNSNIHKFNAFALDYSKTNPEITGTMFDYNLFMKGLILSSSINLSQFRNNDQSAEVKIDTYIEWQNTKEYIGNIYTLTRRELEDRKINVDSIERVANTLEKELIDQTTNLESGFINNQSFSSGDIRSKLNSDEAFIQIIRFPLEEEIIYVALLLTTKNKNDPQLILLKNGKKLENEWYEHYIEHINQGYLHQSLYDDTISFQNYWGNIEPHISGINKVFIIPDGIYNRINPSAFRMPNQTFIYEEHEVITLTSLSDFTDGSNHDQAQFDQAVLVGAPDFNFTPGTGEVQVSGNISANSAAYFDYNNLRAGSLKPLPASMDELNYIDSLLSSRGWETYLFTDKEASELAIKSIKSPKILHISTHGFFRDLNSGMTKNNKQNLDKSHIAARNALFSSGLYLSGAQYSLSGNFIPDEYSEDGILTAYEVTNLDLDSTQLVVLSACETGLGNIFQGEGVTGLQSAFRIAGAENIIMSLWKVDDRATQVFMNKFYSFWLDGHSKYEAFKRTIEYMRFETEEYSHPFYWGAFVYLGKHMPESSAMKPWKLIIPIGLFLLVLVFLLSKKIFSR